jgi:hypothetical protein
MYKEGMEEYGISLFHFKRYQGMIFKSFDSMECLINSMLENMLSLISFNNS